MLATVGAGERRAVRCRSSCFAGTGEIDDDGVAITWSPIDLAIDRRNDQLATEGRVTRGWPPPVAASQRSGWASNRCQTAAELAAVCVPLVML